MAGKNIKGITIKLDGDTGSLTSDIRTADSNLKSLENQLKAVDKALKLDPSNMQLLTEKQDLLNQEIEQTKDKLEAEKAAAEQAAQALEEGTITQQEYDALQAEIQNTSTKLKELENAAKDAGSVIGSSMQAAGEKIQELGGKVEDFGKSYSQNITAPIVGVGAASIAAFAEVDAGLDTIAMNTGATGQALEDLRGIASDLAVEIPSSFEDAGNAVASVNTRFGLTDQALRDLSGKFLQFSRVTGSDVTQSVNDAQSALAIWNLDVSNAGDYLDYLLATSQRTGASVGELNNLVTANATTFQQMGFSISDAVTFLGDLELSGADSTAVMGGLRRALADAAKNGVPLSQALSDLQEQMQGATTDSEAMQYAIDLFGTKSGPVIANLAAQGKLDFESLGTSLDDFSGTLDTTYENVRSSTDDMQGSMNQLKEAGAALGESVGTVVAPMFSDLAEKLGEVSDWWNQLDGDTQTAIINAALIVAAIGPVITIIGSLITNVGVIISTFGTLATLITGTLIPALTAEGAVITGVALPAVVALAAPILAVVAAIAAVVAIIEAVKSVIENADAWIWGFQELWEGLKDTFQSVWDKIVEVKDGIVENISGLADDVGGFFTDLVDGALTWGSDMLENFVDGIYNAWSSLTTAVADVAGYIADYLGFSEPDKGPLSRFHTFAPDMLDLWNEGVYDNLDTVQQSSEAMAATVQGGLSQTVDYSDALSNIGGQLSDIGTGDVVVNAYFGRERVGTVVASASARSNYVGGGF